MYFPAIAGEHHAGYLYEDSELAALTLTEGVAAPLRSFTLVAEVGGELVGFAAAVPSSFPGTGQIDPSAMLLQYLAVDPDRRHEGIGSALVADIERRSVFSRQNVIVAHVPLSQADFYRANGWDVFAEGRGYAWLPFNNMLRADIADPALGFPLMAGKKLRPKAIRSDFDFPIVRGLPMLDASAELVRRIDTGHIDVHDLDEDTRGIVNMSRADSAARSR
ncbi:Acetyltransferase (GNAT) domain-containing protein [Cryobacterium psychrotolerans]|uniref:Acetyltransferase (GNAT) domain-containing protein n=2 Tax=Cryobacterium psychrotolerans TaxID=386301 RepID=A0A1G9B769_9MICO|nr:Acetyltransferase (GNAT) domain-containing protein [Cryobacterium psychrotolerans]